MTSFFERAPEVRQNDEPNKSAAPEGSGADLSLKADSY
jgi:hypothetical protein